MFLTGFKIFGARILDVSIGTFRTMVMLNGQKGLATLLAFFEVFIWFYAARTALNTTESSLYIPIAYSLGYATGSYLAMILAEKYIKGLIGVQVITKKPTQKLIAQIKSHNFGISQIKLNETDKTMLYIQLKSENFQLLKNLVLKHDANAFIIVNETKYIRNGWVK